MKELFESSYLSVMSEENDKLRKEIERLHSIIKEVREYIEEHSYDYRVGGIAKVNGKELLEILDKVDKGKEE